MVRFVIVGIVIAFLIFYITSSPGQAANIVQNGWQLAVNVAHGIGGFFDKLAS